MRLRSQQGQGVTAPWPPAPVSRANAVASGSGGFLLCQQPCWAPSGPCCSPDRKTDPWTAIGFCQMLKWKLRATPEPGLGGGPAWGLGRHSHTQDRDPDSAAPANPQAAPPLLHPTAWGQRMGRSGTRLRRGLAEPHPEKGVDGRQAGGGRSPTAQPCFQTTCLHQLTTHKLRETAKKACAHAL